jgi:hypothetical protein
VAGTSAGAERQFSETGLAQIRALEQEKASRTPVQRKIESRLLFALYKQRADPRIAAVPQPDRGAGRGWRCWWTSS